MTKNPPGRRRGDSGMSKSQSIRRSSGERISIIFCRCVYLAENTSQPASVEFVRLCGQIMRVAGCSPSAEKSEGIFRQYKNPPGRRRGDSLAPYRFLRQGLPYATYSAARQTGSAAKKSTAECCLINMVDR